MIPYNLLRPGDIIGVENTFAPFDMTEKCTIRGGKYIFDNMTSCHITVAADKGKGVMCGIAMNWPHIQEENLEQYNHGKNGKHIVFIGRHPLIDFQEANDFLWTSLSKRINYDLWELLSFWGYDEWDSCRKLICSDLPREMLKKQMIHYPAEWDKKVSPWGWQIWPPLDQII
jgi:hypothetical protein